MTGLRIRLNFDDDWTVLLGELDPPVPLNTAKTGSAGGAAELTLDEGGRLPIPEHLLEVIPRALLDEAIAQASALRGEWLAVQLPDDWTTRVAPEPEHVITFTLTATASGLRPDSLEFVAVTPA